MDCSVLDLERGESKGHISGAGHRVRPYFRVRGLRTSGDDVSG